MLPFLSSATIIALYITFSLKLNNANMNARQIEKYNKTIASNHPSYKIIIAVKRCLL